MSVFLVCVTLYWPFRRTFSSWSQVLHCYLSSPHACLPCFYPKIFPPFLYMSHSSKLTQFSLINPYQGIRENLNFIGWQTVLNYRFSNFTWTRTLRHLAPLWPHQQICVCCCRQHACCHDDPSWCVFLSSKQQQRESMRHLLFYYDKSPGRRCSNGFLMALKAALQHSDTHLMWCVYVCVCPCI